MARKSKTSTINSIMLKTSVAGSIRVESEVFSSQRVIDTEEIIICPTSR